MDTATIGVRVTPEMKTLLQAFARREQTTESALVKELLEVMLRDVALEGFPKLEELKRPNRDARLSIRLDPEDRMMLTDRASARRMRSATYVSVLVRSHLRSLTPIPADELGALKESISELRAIGKNLNQMAKVLNKGGSAVPGREEVLAMLKIAEGLRDHFKELLKANEKSWSEGHAETSH